MEISVCDRSERRLIFITVPNVFVNMAGGRVWGALFFLFMTFASFSTVIAVFENIMSFCMDMFGFSRNKAALINCIIILLASMPCVLGYNLWSDIHSGISAFLCDKVGLGL